MDDKLNTAYATVSRAKAIAEQVVEESGGGTAVEANPPELTGEEEFLLGIKIGEDSYLVNSPYVVGEVIPGEEEGEFEVQMYISPLALDNIVSGLALSNIVSGGFPCALDYNGEVLVPFITKVDDSSWEFLIGVPGAEQNKIYTYRFIVSYDSDTEEWSVEGSVGEMTTLEPYVLHLIYDNETSSYRCSDDPDYIESALNDPNTIVVATGEYERIGPNALPVGTILRVSATDTFSGTVMNVVDMGLYSVQAKLDTNDYSFDILVGKVTIEDDNWNQEIPQQE